MSITTTSGTVLNGLYVGSSTPVANQKGLLIDNKYFIPLVESSSSGTDTSDATATASDILQDKTAYVNGEKITGTISSYTGSSLIIPGVEDKVLSTAEGIYLPKAVKVAGESDLLAENIKKGVSIFGIVGTLESSDGTSAEYYKCASVSSGTSGEQLEGRLMTMSFIDVVDFTYNTEPTVIHLTMTDTTKTGLDREWVSSDGVYTFKKYVNTMEGYISWGLYKNSDNTYSHYITTGLLDQNKIQSPDGEGITIDLRDPWEIKQLYSAAGFMDTKEISWGHSQEAVGGKTWSGYKAVFDSTAGTWSFEDTVTEGLNYSAVTPVPGFIYNDDCTVFVKSLYVGVAEIPTDNLFYYLPLSENYNTSVGAETSIGTGTLSFTSEDSIKCAKFDGTQYLNTTSLVNQPNMTFSFWAKKTGTDSGVVIGQPYNSYIALSNTSLSLMTNATDTSVNVNTTTWHHYAVKKVGVQWSVYVDGVLEHTWSGNDFDRSGSTMRIGVHGYNQSYLRFNGYLTSIRIYYKALTDAEIVALSKELSPTKQ